ncbi:HSP90 family protein [Demequina sp. NBRC 110052]|uniref:HSP90 family protein n=1 Tax=Demequina sp. NBRC 110052 TaxID=1570341 RepID=UPI0009FDB12F|nr:HSP90 family protein [Demequina sp. NBRC 110052]
MTAPERFQVDLAGVVDLLGRSLYSSPRVYLRELIQNAADAVAARAEIEPGHEGAVSITPARHDGDALVITDDGVGLTASEARELLATVGRSSKKDLLDLPRTDRLGRFGVGLLSAFMVADQIEVVSRSITGAPPCVWTGRSDGTFTVTELEAAEADAVPVGSTVTVRPRPDARMLVDDLFVRHAAARFAAHLKVTVRIAEPSVGWAQVTSAAPFLANPVDRELYGESLLGAAPLATIALAVPETGTFGTAYVLPTPPPPGAAPPARVYLGGMLVGDRVERLLPEWSFFVAVVVDSTGLTPTASREALVDDDALTATREAIDRSLRSWIRVTADENPGLLRMFVAVHGMALKQLCLVDVPLAHVVLPHLVVPTTEGERTLADLASLGQTVHYAPTVDEFRQAAGLTPGLLVNAGHAYDEAILRLAGRLGIVPTEEVDVATLIDTLAPPSGEDAALAREVARRASDVLADRGGLQVEVRSIPQLEVPALYVQDAEALRAADRRRARGEGYAWSMPNPWTEVLDAVERAEAADRSDAPVARLCLNWNDTTVRALARLSDEAVFVRVVQVLLVTALLAGHHPLEGRDRRALGDALQELIALQVGLEGFGELRPEDFA